MAVKRHAFQMLALVLGRLMYKTTILGYSTWRHLRSFHERDNILPAIFVDKTLSPCIIRIPLSLGSRSDHADDL